MKKTFDIVSLGEILIDFVPDGTDEFSDEKFLCKAGGAPLNVLATAAKCGLKTAFIGKVGNDIFGRKLLNTLNKSGIHSDSVIIDDIHNTTLAFVKLDENGERDFSFYRSFGSDIFIDKTEVDREKIASAKIFHFGSLSFTDEPIKSATESALKVAKESGCVVSYDPNYRPPLWRCEADAVAVMHENLKCADIVKLSLEEAALITGIDDISSAIKAIRTFGVKAVIVTDGANDVFFCADDTIQALPTRKVRAIDTTGAGDIFFGTVLSGYVKSGISLDRLNTDILGKFIAKAIEVSAESVTKKGAIASIPDNIHI